MIQNQYNTINNRETKLDLLSVIDPAETPLYASLKKEFRVRSPEFFYYADRLEKPSRKTIADGIDVKDFDNKAKNRVRISQRVQLQKRSWIVSRGQQDDADPAGVADEVSAAKSRSGLELRRDIESVIGSSQEAEFVDAEQGDHLRGLGKFADPDNENIPESVRALSGSVAVTSSLNETGFRKVIQSVYEATGNPKGDFKLYAGPELQNKITGFSRTSDEQNNILRSERIAGSGVIDCAVRIYNSDWGRVIVVPDLFLGLGEDGEISDTSRARGYMFDSSNVSLSFNKDIWDEEYPDLGAGRRGAVWAKFTLINKMPRAMAMFN